jgi:hypothetical protein
MNYVEEIEKYAKMATAKPEDFGYWGNEDMFDTWGFTNIDQNPSSDILDKANFKYIVNDLMGSFPEDFRIETYNHWLVGSVDRLTCRIYEEDRKTIALPFVFAMEWLDKLADYPVADEDTYQEMLGDDSIESIEFWGSINPGYIDSDKNTGWAEEVLHELEVNMDIDVNGSGFNDIDILMAIYNLQLWSAQGYEKWFEFCDQNNLERPQFLINEISKYDETQSELEFK